MKKFLMYAAAFYAVMIPLFGVFWPRTIVVMIKEGVTPQDLINHFVRRPSDLQDED